MTVELPAGPALFVNREAEKARADRAVRDGVVGDRLTVLGLSGPVGVGKTELAYEIGRLLHRDGDFPHVLCLDLDEFRTDGVIDSGDVLTQLLESLGVEPASVKRPFGARRRQYRMVTSQTRLVLVLDNARYGSEVADLLPACAGVVVVTSHRPLYDLDGGAATTLPVGPLDAEAARRLLEAIVPDGRLAADPRAARALMELCDGSPAALRIAACTVRGHGLRPLARLLEDVRAVLDERVTPLVDRVLDVAYGELSPSAAHLYRVLSGYPGLTFTRAGAAALLGCGADAGDAALEELDRAGLLDVRSASGDEHARLRLGRAQRAHARGRARQEPDGEAELTRAQERFVRWYVRQQQRADLFVAGERLSVTEKVAPIAAAPDVPLPDPRQADGDERAERVRKSARWQYAERHTLFDTVRLAHDRGWDAMAVALCEPAWTYALDHPPRAGTDGVFALGVECATRLGDIRAVVRMRSQLARILWESGRTDEAAENLAAAAAAADLLGTDATDTKLRASLAEFQGMLHGVLDDWASAAAYFTRSRALHESIDNAYGVMLQDYRLGQARAHLGDAEGALRLLETAHRSAVELGRERMAARTGFSLGHLLLAAGEMIAARRLYEQSLASARGRGSRFDEARVLDALAELAEREGRSEEAGRHRTAAGELRRRDGAQ